MNANLDSPSYNILNNDYCDFISVCQTSDHFRIPWHILVLEQRYAAEFQ